MGGRREDDIEGDSEGLIYHLGDDSGEEGRGEFEAGVGVDFDQPGVEVAVYHKVESKDLKVVLEPFRGQFDESAPDGIEGNFFHSGQNHFLEVILLFPVFSSAVQVLLELGVGNLIPCLITPVIGQVLLNCIVGQVDLSVQVKNVELVGGSPDVPLLVPVTFEHPI